MKIIHIITGLGDGGAENILRKICEYDLKNKHVIISFQPSGKYSKILKKKIGIEVYHLNLRFFSFIKFLKLIRLIKSLNPDIVQTWLIHGDLIGGIAAKLAGIKNIIWNIRYSSLTFENTNISNLILSKLLIILSNYIPKIIIVGSKSAKKNCEKIGFSKNKLVLIVNGYELLLFKSNERNKVSFKKKFNINNSLPVIGNVARYDKVKDHFTLLQALSIIKSKKIDFFCVLAGSEIDKKNLILNNQIKKYNLETNVKLLGKYNHVFQIMNAIDIYVQSSKYGEGFPNVIAEAMACKSPCVATNSGDASFIIGKTGWIVPPNNPQKLAKALIVAILEKNSIKWYKRRNQARLRIKKNFPIDKMIINYNNLWSKVNDQNI